jgi:hypothetical protein
MSKKKKAVLTEFFSKQEQLIYCGPNIPGGVLQRYSVYKGIPGYLNDLFNKCSAVEKLFVPVKELAKTEKAIKTKGTPENTFYYQVMKFIEKGGV